MRARSSTGSKYTIRPSRAASPGSSTTGVSTPATTCAFVTTRSGAITNPDPVALVPHEKATPDTRATDAAAAESSGSSSATGGAVGWTSRSSSAPSCGSPSSRTAERTRASASATGRGVSASIVRSTWEDAIAVETTGAPVAATLEPIRLSDRAPARTARAPPSTRSITRRGVARSTPRRSAPPTAPPSAEPPTSSRITSAITANTRVLCHGQTSFTIGTSQNAASPPATIPRSTPRLARSPRCTPTTSATIRSAISTMSMTSTLSSALVCATPGVQRTHREPVATLGETARPEQRDHAGLHFVSQ